MLCVYSTRECPFTLLLSVDIIRRIAYTSAYTHGIWPMKSVMTSDLDSTVEIRVVTDSSSKELISNCDLESLSNSSYLISSALAICITLYIASHGENLSPHSNVKESFFYPLCVVSSPLVAKPSGAFAERGMRHLI